MSRLYTLRQKKRWFRSWPCIKIRGGEVLVFKCGCDACLWTLKIDPKQIFGMVQKYTENHFQTI